MAVSSFSNSHLFPLNLSRHSFPHSKPSSSKIQVKSLCHLGSCGDDIRCRHQTIRIANTVNCHKLPIHSSQRSPSRKHAVFYLPNSNNDLMVPTNASRSQIDASLEPSIKQGHKPLIANGKVSKNMDPFRGKSGSISFSGLTHQLVEEGKLASSPFKDGTGSLLWVLGPVALILSLVLPQFFLNNIIDAILKDEILADIITSISTEVMFYFGLAAFLVVIDRVQKPYLQFSPKRWGLITGLRGYLSSAFFIMGIKVFIPVLAVYVVWPMIGLPAVVAVAPFLLGCCAQWVFEAYVEKLNSSCWPTVPIIFEVYRLYQLTRGAHIIEKVMLSMRGSAVTPELMEMTGALLSMLVVFQVLGIVCLWSLTTFLLRLFPSRPVAERY